MAIKFSIDNTTAFNQNHSLFFMSTCIGLSQFHDLTAP